MIPVVDVFAGPGGLNEGFSGVRDSSGSLVFKTVASIEMESSAVKTLQLRSAFRILRKSGADANAVLSKFLRKQITLAELEEEADFIAAFSEAKNEVHQFELAESSRDESDKIIRNALVGHTSEWVLIGGPPCQAYSLAGRSRRTHDVDFEDDHKHFLYKEYLHIIATHKPAVFVMENVKGLLSSVNRGVGMFELICQDLTTYNGNQEYDLYSMVKDSADGALAPIDFLIRSEDYGIPQKRHRLIIVGIRRGSNISRPDILDKKKPVSVKEAIGTLPKVRSSISRYKGDDSISWNKLREQVGHYVPGSNFKPNSARSLATSSSRPVKRIAIESLSESARVYQDFVRPEELESFPILNHEARSHMDNDLLRYGSMSLIAHESAGPSPKVRDLEKVLWPKHKNIDAEVVPFADRFRVQVNGQPSTTIVSHIAKDGHYYIHPDPEQMRSLTVREAARLQTFPDDYVFLGNRTQQFTQVGNAVPPLLARQIGERVAKAMRPSDFS